LPEDFDARNREHRMIRLYLGLEEADYLIADMEQAFISI
jgi:cystathionine beta-lyase/cystathionine gamma-synthase